jgi:hypothetical protein
VCCFAPPWHEESAAVVAEQRKAKPDSFRHFSRLAVAEIYKAFWAFLGVTSRTATSRAVKNKKPVLFKR